MIKNLIKISTIIMLILGAFTFQVKAFTIPNNFQSLERTEKIEILKEAINEIRAKILKIQIAKIAEKISELNNSHQGSGTGTGQPLKRQEEEVEDKSECTKYEKYDSQKEVCYFEYKTEKERVEIEDKIDEEIENLEDYLDDKENTDNKFEEFDGDDELDGKIEAIYDIKENENFVLKEGEEKPDNVKIKKWLAVISPDDFSDKYLTKLIIYDDMMSDTLASVDPVFEGSTKWNVYVNMASMVDGEKEMKVTLTHEFAHILTLNNSQLTNNDNCKTFEVPEGCTTESAYINKFYNQFWKGKFDPEASGALDNYEGYESSFVGEYAATNPGEDIAESFAYFVFRERPKTLQNDANKKLDFFYQYPKLVEIRKNIRTKITTSRARLRVN